jgi:hypothetical protein
VGLLQSVDSGGQMLVVRRTLQSIPHQGLHLRHAPSQRRKQTGKVDVGDVAKGEPGIVGFLSGRLAAHAGERGRILTLFRKGVINENDLEGRAVERVGGKGKAPETRAGPTKISRAEL